MDHLGFFLFSLYVLVSTSTYAAEASLRPPSVRRAVDCTYSRLHRTHSSIKKILKVGSYDTYLWYWRSLTPQVITFDPEGVRA